MLRAFLEGSYFDADWHILAISIHPDSLVSLFYLLRPVGSASGSLSLLRFEGSGRSRWVRTGRRMPVPYGIWHGNELEAERDGGVAGGAT